MDENTIFQTPQIPKQSTALPQPVFPAESSSETPPSPPKSKFPKILKLFLGVIVVIVVGFIAFGLVGSRFGGNKSNKVILSYWGLWEDVPTVNVIISDFERQYPNIKIDYSKQDIKQYRERLTTRIQNGNGPDIFRFHNSWLPMLSGALLPLPTDVMAKSEFEKSFYPVAKKDLTKNGAVYGIPLQIDTLSLYINNQLFNAVGLKPPVKWEDFVSASRQLTVKDQDGKIKTAGAAMGTFGNITHAPDIISLLFVQNGVNVFDISSNPDRASEALAFYTDFAKGSASVWDDTLDSSIISFSKGSLAMYFGYSWDFFMIKAINPVLDFSIYPIPHLQGQNMTIASYWAEGASAKSKNQKEALLFMKFLSQKSTLQKLFTEEAKRRTFGEPYPRVDLASSLKDNKFLFPFVSQANDAASSFFVDSTYDNGLNTKANAYLENAVSSVLKDNSSPKSAVGILSQGVNQLLKQYGQ